MWLLIFTVSCTCYEIFKIPESGSPPSPRLLVASVYDPFENRLIFFGGEGAEGSNDLSSILFTFNLKTLTWDKISSRMGIVPPGLQDVFMYLRESDRKIFVFGGISIKGESSVLYSFDLIKEFWNIEITKGEALVPILRPTTAHFSYNDVNYIAIYGGSTKKGQIDDFYLIETEKMFIKKIPRKGEYPGMNQKSVIVYYNESLYMYGYITGLRSPGMYKFILENETWAFVQTYGEKLPNLVAFDIIVKKESFYLVHGVITGAVLPHLLYYRFDLPTSTWIKLSSFLKLKDWTYYHSGVQVKDKYFKGFGKAVSEYSNSLVMIEIGDNDLVIRTILSENFITPEPRRNHLSFVSNQHMYVYGGITEDGIFLKDLWKFNFVEKFWFKVDYSGTPPLDRENMAFTPVFDIGLFAFGGNSGNDFFNDIYFYEVKNDIWVHYKGYKNAPNPRYGSCIVHNKQKLYVIGGQNNQFSFSDIWSFDSLENTFTLLESKLPFSLAFHKCWGVDINDKLYIYVMGGKNFGGLITRAVHRLTVSISEFSVKTEEIIYNYELRLFYTSLVVSGNTAHLFIGSPHESSINATMATYDICKNTLNFTVFPMDYGVFGHSAVHYGKSIYVFGGGYSILKRQIDNSATNNFYNFSLPEFLNCSLGLYEENSECKSCPSGSYGEYTSECNTDEFCTLCSITNNTCNKCPPGRYSDSQGSASQYTCSLCSEGFYSDKAGSTYCRECSESRYCHIGSTIPVKYSEKYEFSSAQPEVYKSQKQFASLFISNLWYSVIILIFILFLSFIFFKKIKDKLLEIDIYSDAHPQELNVPVMYRKTSMGGLFSVIFFVLLISIVISAYINYSYDNILENRTLVPLVTVKEHSEAEDFTVHTKFYVYGGKCLGTGEGHCNSELIIDDYGLSYNKRSVECSVSNNKCFVKMKYNNIKISGDFGIYYKMKEFLSYSNLITVNISVSTGIPEGYSKNFIPIYPIPKNFIFRGTSPTILRFEFIPTFFTSEHSKWISSDKGFHLRYDHNPQYGTMIDSKQLYTTSYLYLKLEFEISNTALNVSRDLKTSLYLMFSGIIGMIAGVLESVGTVMGYFEDIVTGYQLKRGKKLNFKNVTNKREMYNDFFIDNVREKIKKKRMSLLKPKYHTLISRTSPFTENRI